LRSGGRSRRALLGSVTAMGRMSTQARRAAGGPQHACARSGLCARARARGPSPGTGVGEAHTRLADDPLGPVRGQQTRCVRARPTAHLVFSLTQIRFTSVSLQDAMVIMLGHALPQVERVHASASMLLDWDVDSWSPRSAVRPSNPTRERLCVVPYRYSAGWNLHANPSEHARNMPRSSGFSSW